MSIMSKWIALLACALSVAACSSTMRDQSSGYGSSGSDAASSNLPKKGEAGTPGSTAPGTPDSSPSTPGSSGSSSSMPDSSTSGSPPASGTSSSPDTSGTTSGGTSK